MKRAALCLLLCLAGCSTTGTTGVTTPVVTELSTANLEQRIADDYVAPFKAGDVDRWLLIFDDDAVGLHNFLPEMKGKEALRGFASFVRDNLRVEEMSVKLSGVRQDGGLAYSWGTYRSRLIMKSTGQPMPGHSETGKVMFVWKRQADRSWKIVADMGNATNQQR